MRLLIVPSDSLLILKFFGVAKWDDWLIYRKTNRTSKQCWPERVHASDLWTRPKGSDLGSDPGPSKTVSKCTEHFHYFQTWLLDGILWEEIGPKLSSAYGRRMD
jgi:hypothetical protein